MLVKRIASHGAPPSAAWEWRMKAQNEQPNHEPPQATPTPSAPPSISLKFASKVVTTGRKINFQFLANEGFSIGDQLKDMSWGYLYLLDLPTYPNLVRKFYSTLTRGSNGFVSNVRVKEKNYYCRLHISLTSKCKARRRMGVRNDQAQNHQSLTTTNTPILRVQNWRACRLTFFDPSS